MARTIPTKKEENLPEFIGLSPANAANQKNLELHDCQRLAQRKAHIHSPFFKRPTHPHRSQSERLYDRLRASGVKRASNLNAGCRGLCGTTNIRTLSIG